MNWGRAIRLVARVVVGVSAAAATTIVALEFWLGDEEGASPKKHRSVRAGAVQTGEQRAGAAPPAEDAVVVKHARWRRVKQLLDRYVAPQLPRVFQLVGQHWLMPYVVRFAAAGYSVKGAELWKRAGKELPQKWTRQGER
ncbi:hypothetical protein CDCA_CDCA20G4836 [Cyanidium caldarium]|uniref:Uncharacterized protein n=1 Tax=Cyanidium caldarium TaxID=2771 RepID=A0AAV9J3E2_CYACA|nr:hypothetical protein CDCA_CDCA20G4836 [Cyanidium caldarium]